MTIQFILGRSGSGKTSYCFETIRTELEQHPAGDPIIYLVPDQMTFQSEYELVKAPGLGGMIRAQVFSFKRLAWRVLQETGGIARYHLTKTGINILLRKIIETHKEELMVFKRVTDQNGFIEQVETLISEFKRYCIQATDLQAMIASISEAETDAHEEVLLNKLKDLYVIYEQFETEILEKYIDSEDYLQLLAEKVSTSSYLKRAHMIVDGFHRFTPQELFVVEQLLSHCQHITVALTIPEPGERAELFQLPNRTYEQLIQLAKERQVAIEEPIMLQAPLPRFRRNKALSHLEQHYDVRPTPRYQGEAQIQLLAAVNRRTEVESVAREIIEKVSGNEDYRWRDFIILVRNYEDYQHLIETLFADYQLPVFLDQKRSMLNHPLIEFIRSALDIIDTNWRYEPVFRCVKTELLFPVDEDVEQVREAMDELENYVLATGIRGNKWKTAERWTYRKGHSLEQIDEQKSKQEEDIEARIHKSRQLVREPLSKFEKNIKGRASVRARCTLLFNFLEELQIPKKLELMRMNEEAAGRLIQAKEYDQVWRAVIDLLDQFVELMGDEEISFELFRKMMETGFESMKFSLVPPGIDQVLVGDIEHSRFLHAKCTFILGVNDGVLPAKPKEDSVISETERERINEIGFELAPGSRQQLIDENFMIYLALTSCSDQLYVSYPMANEEGKTLVPSVLIRRLKDMFPSVTEKWLTGEPSAETSSDQLAYITTPAQTLSLVAAQLQAWKKGYPISSMWWDAYNWYVNHPSLQYENKRILSSLFYKNEAKPLTMDTSFTLYGTSLYASVSRMEKFNSCAFAQFLSHGLKVKEREMFKLEAPDIGQLFHAALKLIADQLTELGKTWSDLTTEDCHHLAGMSIDKLAPRLGHEILLSSSRFYYIKRKLQEVVGRAATILRDHAKVSGFTPVGIELAFGKAGELPPIQFTLDNGCKMEVAGRIDRVDKLETDNGLYLRIIDFKSSQKSLNLDEVYFGLALQMLTYLDVVITHAKSWLGKEALPAGVLYFHVHNPMINHAYPLDDEQISDEVFKKFKMKGLLLAEEAAVRNMDTTLESGHSTVVPAGLKKSGGFYSHSSIASAEEFADLSQYIRKRIKGIGEEITGGKIDINPYKHKGQVPCQFCSYKPICQFDQSLDENDFRQIYGGKDEEILAKMRAEVMIE